MVDFGKCRKSPQTPWNISYMLANGFLTACGIVSVVSGEFARVRNWPIFNKTPGLWPMVLTKWRILVSAGNRSKLPETPPTYLQMVSNYLRDCLCGFGWIRKGPKLADFEQKAWLGKCWKSLQTPCNTSYMLANGCSKPDVPTGH